MEYPSPTVYTLYEVYTRTHYLLGRHGVQRIQGINRLLSTRCTHCVQWVQREHVYTVQAKHTMHPMCTLHLAYLVNIVHIEDSACIVQVACIAYISLAYFC